MQSEGLKNKSIGQSAAKLPYGKKVQRLRPYQPVPASAGKWEPSRTDEDIVSASEETQSSALEARVRNNEPY